MEVDISPDDIANIGQQVSLATGPFFWILVILAGGMIAGMIYVAWGEKFQVSNLLGGMSGVGLIALAGALLVAGVFVTDREVRAWVLIQRNLIDPFYVTILGKDSCNPESSKFCVVVWDKTGKELLVNWHDKRVNAHEVFGGYEFSLFTSARPQMRPAQSSPKDL
ncbi:hypothetical protein E4Z66_10980 [Aliishimia ponticola]|uniref:Uncharacterized protein n=1 Tax=Aliishimia ponticola TaxID=2499833 RepID=A0A4S4ND74_9RHOB|nr:hypothetical protein [Aliishimia ponticola]THH37422.1 hypothetical protein E4Z66_10980 [Aliishimia ponticola]